MYIAADTSRIRRRFDKQLLYSQTTLKTMLLLERVFLSVSLLLSCMGQIILRLSVCHRSGRNFEKEFLET